MKTRILLLPLLLSSILILGAADKGREVVHGRNGISLPPPPATEVKTVTDKVQGHAIADPYRWLEDAKSPETRAWIQKQMDYTESYLKQVKIRPEIEKRLSELQRVETYGAPAERNGRFFFTKRMPDENQASIYLRQGLKGSDERLIDPTKLSADPNTSVSISSISNDGSLLVYGVRSGGADETVLHIYDVEARKDTGETLPSARYSGVSVAPDKKGLYYGKLEDTGSVVMHHAFRAPVSKDEMVFGKEFEGDKFGPMQLISAQVTENQRYLLITVAYGVPPTRVDIYAKDLRNNDSPIRKVVHGIKSRFTPLNEGDELYLLTDNEAPKGRVIRVPINDPAQANWKTIIPEGADVISNASIVGGKLFITGLHDVVTEARIFSLDGKPAGDIKYPTLGSATPVRGRQSSNNGFYSFQSFNIPPTIYRYDVATGKTDLFAKPKVPFASDQFEVKQVFYHSKDGTRVPMFIASRKGLKRDGTARALMFAYGGFNSNMTATWSPEYAWWMEQGGFYAQPNLRGGGEYGEEWHKAGMFEKKQNVFDDFYAAAEYLIANRYTNSSRLAIRGRSNGGLLMGAAMTQRPDLFGAIWCGYPLLDMIRFQKFLVGRWWTTEYGSSDNPEQFAYLLKYSPYQNVKPGTKYPAIMFNTGDSDTRVDPLHARKMTALMQASTGSDRPILLHYETQAGHSSGVSIEQLVKDTADELAFLWNETSKK